MKYLFESLLGWMNGSQLNTVCLGSFVGSLFAPNPYSIILFIVCITLLIYRIK